MSGTRSTRGWLSALVLVAVASAMACGTIGSQPLPTASFPAAGGAVAPSEALTPQPPASSVAAASPAPGSPAAPPPPPTRPVTIAFAGDIHTEGPASVVVTSGLGPVSDLLAAADLAIVNLETAIVTSADAVPDPKTYTFQTSPQVLDGLAGSGVDVASMANNHGMDYGTIGLADSVAAIAATPVPAVIGIGATAAQAWAPYVTEVGGRSIGVLGATDVLESESWVAQGDTGGLASAKNASEERLIAETAALAERVDIAIVFLHWGRELEVCPTERQQGLAQRLSDAGADIVAGSHAHVIQPVATVGATTVAYGLGNFAWYHSREPSSITGVLTVTVAPDDTQTTSWQPAKISGGLPLPQGAPVSVPVTGCA